MLAVSHGRLDMVKLLLEANADVNIQDEVWQSGYTIESDYGAVP